MVKLSLNKEKTNYIKLIQLMILNNKTLLGLFQIATIVGVTFLFSITSLSETIIRTKQENAVQSCGKFLMVMSDVSNDLMQDVKEKNRKFSFQTFDIGGNIKYSDKKLTYGAMDEKMGNTFGFQLLNGKWPKNSNQIVIENYVAYLFGIQDQKLPVSIPLTINGQSTQYSVTGIISNYSHMLADYCNSSLKTKAYPSIIFEKGQLKHPNHSLVVLQKKLNPQTISDESTSILMKDYIENINTQNTCENVKLEFYAYEEMQDMMEMKVIYHIIVNLLLIFVFIIMIKVVLTSNKKTLSLFEAIGLTKKKKRILVLGIISLIILCGLVMGGIVSSLFGMLYINKIFPEYSNYYYSSLGRTVIVECIIIGLILIAVLLGYRFNWNESIIHGLSATNSKTVTHKYKFKKLDCYTIIMQAICIFFIIASINFAESFHCQEKQIVYDLYSKQIDACLPIKGYRFVKNNREYFSYNDIDTLKGSMDNVTLQMKAETKQSSILIKKEWVDESWQAYIADDNSELTPEKQQIWNQVSEEADKYSTIDSNHFEILVLPQRDFLHFLRQKGIQNTTLEQSQEKGCVLLLPEYFKGTSKNFVQKGDNIMLGRIDGDTGHLNLSQEAFQVEEILNGQTDSSKIQIVISEEIAKKSKLVLGYDTIHVVMKPDSSQDTQKELEEKISLIMASVQGGMLDSSVARNEDAMLMDNFSSILSKTLIFFCLCAICIYILMNHYIEWERNKFEYGVLRSFGMSYSALQRKLFIRYQNSILVASIVSIAIGNCAFPNGLVTIQQIIISLVITFSITYLCKIITYYRNGDKPICSMLNRS